MWPADCLPGEAGMQRISEFFVSKQFFSLQSLVDSDNSIRKGAGEGLSPRVCNTVNTSRVHTLSA